MQKIKRGEIFFATYPDPNGQNQKHRPTLVISESSSEGVLTCVAISHTLPNPLTDNLVLVPYANSGPCVTGLKQRSAAVCNWIVEVKVSDADPPCGVLPAKYLLQVIQKAKDFLAE